MPHDGPMTGPFTDGLVPRKRITPALAAKQKSGNRKPRQCFGGITYSILPESRHTTHSELIQYLEDDVLFNTWFNKLHYELGFKTFGLLPLIKEWAKPPQNDLEESQIQIKEYQSSTRAIHKAFETYKTIIRKYKILGPDFLRTEIRRAEVWQHILVDMDTRFADLLDLGILLTGKDPKQPLPKPFLTNVWYAWGWLKVTWREINSCHIFLKRNWLEDDGSFGELRDPAPQLGSSPMRAVSDSSEDDSLSRTKIRARVSVRRSNTLVGKLRRLGSKIRK